MLWAFTTTLAIINTIMLAVAIRQRSVKLSTVQNTERIVMGLKEDFATLQGKFDSTEAAVTAVAEDIAALKNEIKEANDRANIDLSPLIARAEGIEAGLRAAVGAQPGSDPEASPSEGEGDGTEG